jgi:hypothetical protein
MVLLCLFFSASHAVISELSRIQTKLTDRTPKRAPTDLLMVKSGHRAAKERGEYRRHNQPKNKNDRQEAAKNDERCRHPFEHDLQNRSERNIEIHH